MTDQELLDSFVRRHSMGAFEEILNRHGPMVYRICRRMLRSTHEAEDASQSAFLIFLEKAARLGKDTVLSAWLYRTAVHVSRNRTRRLHPRSLGLPLKFRETEIPSALLAGGVERVDLDAALGRLPRRLQEALVLHYLQGRSLAETARELGCPIKTLEKRVSTGLDRLRSLLPKTGFVLAVGTVSGLLRPDPALAISPRLRKQLLEEAAHYLKRTGTLPRLGFAKRLAIPLAAGLIGMTCWAGRLMLDEPSGGPIVSGIHYPSSPESRGHAHREEPLISLSLSSSAAASTPRPFPESFWALVDGLTCLRGCPERLEYWERLGISMSIEELREILSLMDDDPDALLTEAFRRWGSREPRNAADWLYRAFTLIPPEEGWTPYHSPFLETVLASWRACDSEGAKRWVAELPPGFVKDVVTAEWILAESREPRADWSVLSKRLLDLPASQSRLQSMVLLTQAWAAQDPQTAAAWVAGLPRLPEFDGVGEVFTLGQPDEPEMYGLGTRTQAEGQVNPVWAEEGRSQSMRMALVTWAKKDLEAARLWCECLPPSDLKSVGLDAIGKAWAEQDPRALLEYVSTHSVPDPQGWLSTAVGQLARIDPQAAAASALRNYSPSSGSMLHAVAEAWAAKDPQAAADWVSTLEPAPLRQSVSASLGAAWASADPRGALEWSQNLPESVRRAVLLPAARSLAGSDRELALQVLSGLPPGGERREALGAVGSAWSRSSPDLAAAWALSLPDPAERDGTLFSVLSTWAETDPAGAEAKIGLLSDPLREQAASLVEQARLRIDRTRLRQILLSPRSGS